MRPTQCLATLNEELILDVVATPVAAAASATATAPTAERVDDGGVHAHDVV